MRADFEQFLTSPGTFFVMEHDQKLVGYGGFSIQNASAAALRWGTIHPDFRRMGLGRFLLMYRMREIGRAGNIATVSVQPPPEFSGFYEKQGFRPAGTVLLKKLAVCP
jgi:ribosomal protein S18 acetylase RimI-like enzyme